MGFSIENFNENSPDNLSFGFRIGNALQLGKKHFASIHSYHVQPHVLIRIQHTLIFILAEQSIINKDTGKVLANGFMQQYCCHRAIDTSRQAQNNIIAANLLLQL